MPKDQKSEPGTNRKEKGEGKEERKEERKEKKKGVSRFFGLEEKEKETKRNTRGS